MMKIVASMSHHGLIFVTQESLKWVFFPENLFVMLTFISNGHQDPLALESAVDENENRQESDVKSRIPEGAEATNVLVGTLDELEHPVLAFVRLAKGCHLEQMTEVSIPVRFLFVLLGPSDNGELYHQMGRSIATLMSDQVSFSFL